MKDPLFHIFYFIYHSRGNTQNKKRACGDLEWKCFGWNKKTEFIQVAFFFN